MKKSFLKLGFLLILLSVIITSCNNKTEEKQDSAITQELGHSTIQIVDKLNAEAAGKVDFGNKPHLSWIDKEGVEYSYIWENETLIAYFSPEVEVKRQAALNAQRALIEAQREALRQQQAEKEKAKKDKPIDK